MFFPPPKKLTVKGSSCPETSSRGTTGAPSFTRGDRVEDDRGGVGTLVMTRVVGDEAAGSSDSDRRHKREMSRR